MKLLKKLSCFIVATCIAISCVSCSTGDTTWAFEYDGTSIGSGLYIGMSISAYMEASSLITDYTQDVLTQYVEDVPAKDWIINKTQELASRYVTVENEFNRLGLELTPEQNTQIDDELKVLWNSAGDIYEANGVGRSSYRLILQNSKKEEALFNGYYGEGGVEEVSTDDLFEYYDSEYAIINAMSIVKSYDAVSFEDVFDEENPDKEIDLNIDGDESVDSAYERALSYVDRINDGESFNKLVVEYTAELEAEAAAAAELEAEESDSSDDDSVFDVEYIDAEDAEEFKAELEKKSNSANQSEDTDDEDEDETLEDEDETLEDEDETLEDEDETLEDETTEDEDEATEDEDETLEDEDETLEDEDEATEDEDEVEIADDSSTKFPIARTSTSPSAEFVDQIFQMPRNGKAEVIEDLTVYYVIIRYEIEEDDSNFDMMKESLRYQLKSEDYSNLIDELLETVEPTAINQASITRYDPKNIDLS